MNLKSILEARKALVGRVALKTFEALDKMGMAPIPSAVLAGATANAVNSAPRFLIVLAVGVVRGAKTAAAVNLGLAATEYAVAKAYGIDTANEVADRIMGVAVVRDYAGRTVRQAHTHS